MIFFLGEPDKRLELFYRWWQRLPRVIQQILVDRYSDLAAGRMKSQSGPKRLVLFVTVRCNRRCDYCFYRDRLDSSAGSELTLSEVRQLAKTLPQQLATITITGGEPFFRDDLPDLVDALFKGNRCRLVTINTNGDMTEKVLETVNEIINRDPIRLQLHVSIQNMEDLAGAPGRTLDGLLQRAKTNRRITRVAAQTTITKENVDEIPDLIRSIRARGALPKLQHVRGGTGTIVPMDDGRLADIPDTVSKESLAISEQEKINRVVYQLLSDAKHPLLERAEWLHLQTATRVQKAGHPIFKCGAGTMDAVVFENGDVSICEPLLPTASLREYGMNFHALWESDSMKQARRDISLCACTHPCNIATASGLDRGLLRDLLL